MSQLPYSTAIGSQSSQPLIVRWFCSDGAKAILKSRAFWCLLVALVVCGRYLANDPMALLKTLGDTDDATRLIAVRMLLAGTSWFDMTLTQFGAPDALVSHWSRLVDLPLAILIVAFKPIFGSDGAETATRLIWPLMVLIAMTYLVVREAEINSGMWAGVIAAVLIVAGPITLFQFMPGRLDHHNVQILGVAGGLILLQRALFQPRIGYMTGALLALGLSVGYEALILTAAVLGLAALFACFVSEMREGLVRVLCAFAAVLTAAYFATTAPSQWLNVACDTLSLNLVALVVCGVAALWGLNRYASDAGPAVWLAGLVGGGVAGLILFGILEPTCLAGPLAGIDPAVKPIWLDHVREVQSLIEFSKNQPMYGLTYGISTLTIIAILIQQFRQERSSRTAFSLALVIFATAYGFIYVRLIPYAMWIILPALACWIARLPAIGKTPARTVRLAAIVFLNQMVIMVGTQTFGAAVLGITADKASKKGATAGCERRQPLREFGHLKPGLVISDIDLGPHIAAHGPHRVMAAPYHRLDQAIIALDGILKSKPSAAEKKLRDLNASYVVLCAKGLDKIRKRNKQTLEDILRLGKPVSYLKPIKIGDGKGLLKAWRIKSR